MVTIQVRRDTAANWTSQNPTLATGEIGYETDTGKFKIGHGSIAWNTITDYYYVPNDTVYGAGWNADLGSATKNAIYDKVDTMDTAIGLNTAKDTNVSTELSTGTRNATTYGITSDSGADDVVLVEATTALAGLLGADKWDEIVANTLKNTNVPIATDDIWVATGDLAVGTGENTAGILSKGANGQVLTMGAATPAWAAAGAPGHHHDTHDPEDGADALDCAAPSELASVQAAAEGSAHEFARADHAHQIQESMADNHLVTVNDADAAENDYTKFTGTGGLEGRSYTEVKQDLNLEIGTDVLAQQTIGIADGNLVDIDAGAGVAEHDYVKFTTTGLIGKSYSEVLGDLSGTAGADFAMNSKKITGLADPVGAQDAATKASSETYADAVASGLDLKDSVVTATAAALPACTAAGADVGKTLTGDVQALLSVDGQAVVATERLLVKNQVDKTDNGIYTVTAIGGGAADWVLTRATDFDTDAEVTPGAYCFVEEGTANADEGWVLTTDGTIDLETTELEFSQFSGAGQITAGSGMTKTGDTLNVIGGTGITANADDIEHTAHTGDVTGATALTIGDDKVTYAKMQNVAGADVLLGNTNAGGSIVAELNAAAVLDIIGVESGADVTDATNVNAAGATMNADTDVKANGWTIDENDMASDLDTRVPTQQSTKYYVDNHNIDGGSA